MSVKDKIKGIFEWLQVRRFGVVAGQGVYIGKHCGLKGKNNITLEDSVTVRPYAQIWSGGGTVRIGRGSEIGERCRISIANSLNMGEKVLLSPNVYITDCDHEYCNLEVPVIDQGVVQRGQTVSIGDGSYRMFSTPDLDESYRTIFVGDRVQVEAKKDGLLVDSQLE